MLELLTPLVPGVLFWASFAFSPGPFWMAWMDYHSQENDLSLLVFYFRRYLPYVFLVFSVLSFVLCYFTLSFSKLTDFPLTPLYFLGGCFIVYLAVKSFYAQIKKMKINFTIWNMILISVLNPKVYSTIPAGSLSMLGSEESIVVSSFVFGFVIMPPVMLLGSFFFLGLSKIGKSLLAQKVRYLTSSLLFIYGLYLFYEGVKLLI